MPAVFFCKMQVLFQYLPELSNGAGDTFLGIPLRTTGSEGTLPQAKMDLVLTIGGKNLAADFMVELFEEAMVSRLLGSFVAMLQQAVQHPDSAALVGNLMTAADAEQVAHFSCGPLRPEFLECPLFPDAFAAVVAGHASQRCLVYEGMQMSYSQVNTAAGELAATLAGQGIGPGTVVGIMLDRGFDLVIAILGTLKAGGKCWWPGRWQALHATPQAWCSDRLLLAALAAAGYLPCDPAYPDDRLQVRCIPNSVCTKP